MLGPDDHKEVKERERQPQYDLPALTWISFHCLECLVRTCDSRTSLQSITDNRSALDGCGKMCKANEQTCPRDIIKGETKHYLQLFIFEGILLDELPFSGWGARWECLTSEIQSGVDRRGLDRPWWHMVYQWAVRSSLLRVRNERRVK